MRKLIQKKKKHVCEVYSQGGFEGPWLSEVPCHKTNHRSYLVLLWKPPAHMHKHLHSPPFNVYPTIDGVNGELASLFCERHQ